MIVKAFWHNNKNTSEIKTEQLNFSNINQAVKLHTRYSSISIGTEKLVANGEIPIDLYTKMKVNYMEGGFGFPIKYGYSLVGETDEHRWVHVMHPHQDQIIVNNDDCYFFSQEDIDPVVATQFSNLETVINAIWTSNVKQTDIVLICGTGSIGILLAQTIKKHIGATVFVQETNPLKKEKLKHFGFDLCANNLEYDITFNVSANQKGLQYCIDHTVEEGKIIEVSWYGNNPVVLQLGGNFHYKRLQIISSQVSAIPNEKKETYTFLTRKQLVEHLLKTIDYKIFISNTIPFDELPLYFDQIRKNKPSEDFITIVKY
jgi:threonine dehydrogenase-like Zn-dependent dehydrogenase